MTQEELELNVSDACLKFKLKLNDSPIGLGKELERQIGYYLGYCHASGWEPDYDLIEECRAV